MVRITRHLAVVLVAGSLALSGCSAASSPTTKSGPAPTGSQSTTNGAFGTLPAASGTPIKGGTITYPITAGEQPTYIFPLLPGEDNTVYNLEFQTLLYRPLYWTSVGNRPIVNPDLSLAAAPIYSNGNKTVTINLSHSYSWADGHSVDAQDVLFFIDLVRAAVKENASNFGAYSKGTFPDNVVNAVAKGKYTVVLTLDRGYNPDWFSYTQLTRVTPMPSTSWDHATAGGPALDFAVPANAKRIYDYLDAQSKQVSTYASNPLWADVDGPFKLTAFNTTTDANTMVPNPTYGGPQKPVFSTLKAVYYASSTAEFNAVRAGTLNEGFFPPSDIPLAGSVERAGYHVYGYPGMGFQFMLYNFKDTTDNWDKVIGQLYIRQALAHLQNQPAIIHGVYHGAAAPDYGPIPPIPTTKYVPHNASDNPYPFSVEAASKLLSSHGWKVVPNGTTTCQDPGTASNQCGAGIPAGQKLAFTNDYANDPSDLALESNQLASAAKQVGITVTPVAKSFNFIVDQYDDPIAPENNNKWQAQNYGGFTLGPYPTTDTIFNTGGSDNDGDYSNPRIDRLIEASKYGTNPSALRNEAAAITKDLPAIFLPNEDIVVCWKGISGPPDSFANLTQSSFTPEYWYLTSS